MTGNAVCAGLLHNLVRPQLADLILTSCLGATWVKSSSVFCIEIFLALFFRATVNLSLDCVFYIFYGLSCGLSLIWKAVLLQSRFPTTTTHTRAALGSGVAWAFESL